MVIGQVKITNSVTPKMGIDTNMVTAQTFVMATKTENLLPDDIREQMKPARIGYRLMLVREALGMNQADISDSLGIPRPYWNRFEKGERAVSDTVAALLMARHGVSLDYLVYNDWSNLPLSLAEKMRSVEAALASEDNGSNDVAKNN